MEAVVVCDFSSTLLGGLNLRKGCWLVVLDTTDDRHCYRVEVRRSIGYVPVACVRVKPHGWFCGRLRRSDAEWLLVRCVVGSFVVRYSEDYDGEYCLSVLQHQRVTHYLIQKDHLGFFSIWNIKFASLNLLVKYYSRHSISRSGEDAFLTDAEFCGPNMHLSASLATVTKSFVGASPEELLLEVGEVVVVLGDVREDWLHGRLGGKEGSFPRCFVRVFKYFTSVLEEDLVSVERATVQSVVSDCAPVFEPNTPGSSARVSVAGSVSSSARRRLGGLATGVRLARRPGAYLSYIWSRFKHRSSVLDDAESV